MPKTEKPKAKKKQRLFGFKAPNGKNYRLTPKQKLFCDYYIKTLNGVQSAFEVSDTKDYKTAASMASENLIKPNIVAYLTLQFARFNITPDETMAHLGYLVRQFSDLGAKGRGVDMSLKVFGKYAAEKKEIEHGVSEKLEKFLEKQNKKLP